MIFYYQKKNIYSLDAKIFVEENYADNESGQGKTYGPIDSNESLTPPDRLLLKEARKSSKNLKYKYQGYSVNGQVRVRKLDADELLPINSMSDLRDIE